ncbi:hypothetical protein HK102_006084 [Quaeritorhiza haematococci]|nr:hypothetical protein HK102_006084 [Quaeritorhiza haematococci]
MATKATKLIQRSTVARGTEFERLIKLCLGAYGMELSRVGGAGDQGVDLRGSWTLLRPNTNSPTTNVLLPLFVQCKRYSKPVGPSTLRELEGTAFRETSLSSTSGSTSSNLLSYTPYTVGILACTNGMSSQALDQFQSSRAALAFAVLSEDTIRKHYRRMETEMKKKKGNPSSPILGSPSSNTLSQQEPPPSSDLPGKGENQGTAEDTADSITAAASAAKETGSQETLQERVLTPTFSDPILKLDSLVFNMAAQTVLMDWEKGKLGKL